MHFRKASAVVNFTIYLRGGFRELPRLQFWLPRASWSLQVWLNGLWEVFDTAHVTEATSRDEPQAKTTLPSSAKGDIPEV